MKDPIERQDAIDAVDEHLSYVLQKYRERYGAHESEFVDGYKKAHEHIKEVLSIKVPSVQPERTCVNCGRTANNGGWYADGRTRCPIEEHYVLPKDGYCHLWEKRNVTDDDYPEGRADG